MTAIGRGLDLALALLGATAWALAAFVLGTRFVSPAAGGLLAVGLFLSGLALVVGSQVQDLRLQRLAAGLCPRCRRVVASEHRHRRWDPERGDWQAPSLAWECACGFSYSETWACPTCPPAE